MKRVDIYVKVEVELDEEERPERVAEEICRQVKKMYIVRSAEPSHVVAREEAPKFRPISHLGRAQTPDTSS